MSFNIIVLIQKANCMAISKYNKLYKYNNANSIFEMEIGTNEKSVIKHKILLSIDIDVP